MVGKKGASPLSTTRTRWPKILWVGVNDWGNLANRTSRALNAYAGREISRVWTLKRNPYKYREDWIGPPPDQSGDLPAGLVQWARWGQIDWIITTGDGEYNVFLQQLDALQAAGAYGKYLAVTHPGSVFRASPKEMHEADWELGARVRFVGHDCMRLVPADPMKAIPTFPYWSSTDDIKLDAFTPNSDAPLRVCHSPSNRAMKGTDIILPVLEKLADEGLFEVVLIENVPAAEAIARRRSCQLYVDQMNPDVGGFGCAAIEAMAVGCGVLGDTRHVYDTVAAAPPIIPVATATVLEDMLRFYARNRNALDELRETSEQWIATHATPRAVGKRFLEILEAHS